MKPDISTLEALLARVEAATGPDRVLDAHIMCTLNDYTMHEGSNPSDGIFAFWDGEPWESTCHNCTQWPEVTVSLDACRVLQEQVLPEHFWHLGPLEGEEYAHEHHEFGCLLGRYLHVADKEDAIGYGATPSLAWLAAILRALIAQAKEQAHGE